MGQHGAAGGVCELKLPVLPFGRDGIPGGERAAHLAFHTLRQPCIPFVGLLRRQLEIKHAKLIPNQLGLVNQSGFNEP